MSGEEDMTINNFIENQSLDILTKLPVGEVMHERDEAGHVVRLEIWGIEGLCLDYFPEQICGLTFMKKLIFCGHTLERFPECILSLTSLEVLDISDNKILEIPPLIKHFPKLNVFYMADKLLEVPRRNLLECLDINFFKEKVSVNFVMSEFKKFEIEERAEWEELERKFATQQERKSVVYPPKELLKPPQNCPLMILWMLDLNYYWKWADFITDPVNMNPHLLHKYISFLSVAHLIRKVSRGTYLITNLGKKKLNQLLIEEKKEKEV